MKVTVADTGAGILGKHGADVRAVLHHQEQRAGWVCPSVAASCRASRVDHRGKPAEQKARPSASFCRRARRLPESAHEPRPPSPSSATFITPGRGNKPRAMITNIASSKIPCSVLPCANTGGTSGCVIPYDKTASSTGLSPKFLRWITPSPMGITCNTAAFGLAMTPPRKRAGVRGKLRARFSNRLRLSFGDHELGKL